MILTKYQVLETTIDGYGNITKVIGEFYNEASAKRFIDNLAAQKINDEEYELSKTPITGVLLIKLGKQIKYIINSIFVDTEGLVWEEPTDEREIA